MGPVGYIVRYYPTRSETFVAREVAGLRARGIEVDVVAIGSRADGAGLPDDGVVRPPAAPVTSAVRRLADADGRRVLAWLARQVRPRQAARAAWVAELGARRGWQRVHAHFAGEASEWAAAVAEILGIPYAVTVHAVDLFVPRPALARVLAGAAQVITVCDHHVRWLAERHGVDAHLVRCGVPIDVPLADPGSDGSRFVCVARDVPKKGLDDLVPAVRAVPGATLRLVSDAHRLGGPRVAVGPVPPARVGAILARAHAFALACRVAPDGDRDGLPVSILEAMAAGLPVVATDVAGIAEVVDEDVGWLVPPGDARALARALADAAEPAARAHRGRAARARIMDRGLTVDGQVDALLRAWGRDATAPSG